MTAPAHRPAMGVDSHAGSSSIALPHRAELLHGITLRPPFLSWDGSAYTGPRLTQANTETALGTPGVVTVVIRHDFIGIIASQPGQALQARSRLQPAWAVPVASAGAIGTTPKPNHSTGQTLASGQQGESLSQTYLWPSPPSHDTAWAIAHYTDGMLTVWANTSHANLLHAELAQLCGLPAQSVRLISNGQAGVEGYDLAADAALLSLSCSRPVRVQQHTDALHSEPVRLSVSARLNPPQASDSKALSSGGHAQTGFAELTLTLDRPLARRPSIAALLCGLQSHYPADVAVCAPGYLPDARYLPANIQTNIDASTPGLTAAAQVFAQESFFDEACAQHGRDPVQARLDAITDPAGRNLIASVASRANWSGQGNDQHTYQGRGFAYSHVIDQTQQPPSEVWSAWVADVQVNPETGAINLTGLTVGHNSGALKPAPDDAPLIEHDIRQAAARWLSDASGFDTWGKSSSAKTDFPLGPSATQVQLVDQGPVGLAWSRSAELPAAAAIANAIHDATGIRMRQAPFDADELKKQLALSAGAGRYKKTAYALLGGIAAAVGGLLVTAMPWRAAIAPVANIDTSIYSAAAIERGRLVAAAGDCMVCHTAENGVPNAGGLPLETPFGTVYTTNITPDKASGIGAWSYAAFERAMRQGIHRDGRHLYPAFPYTAFAKITDADMQSLYAYLMTQEPVSNQVAPTQLSFPYNARPLLAGWNLLFHDNQTYQPDPSQTTLWNRGAYLVQGMGHCSACHTPRNALGAEKSGDKNFLAGGFAEGWEAPALNALSKAPIPWTEDELYRYLRTGYSALHGVASGPMAPVVQSMAELPDEDVRAVAHYLGTLAAPAATDISPALLAAQLEERSRNDQRVLSLSGENLFQGACAVCHDAREGPPLFGARPSLALNTNLHSDSPDNAIQILLRGIDNPAMAELGYMPGFGDSMNDEQLETLLEYLRMRFAPDQPAWEGLPEKIRTLRESATG